MKFLLSLVTGLVTVTSVWADCAGGGLWVFPRGNTIRQNPVFVLHTYANSQELVPKLGNTIPVYLQCGDKKVKLNVVEICEGQMYLTQAILKPEQELEAGLEYTFILEAEGTKDLLQRYNQTTRKFESVTYKVLSGSDLNSPEVATAPVKKGEDVEHFGCGPAVNVLFSNPAKDDSEIIVKTTVKNFKTGKETTYYIEPDEDGISVGHGMCSGAFVFDKGVKYEVEFTFMDASGNITGPAGKRIPFTGPDASWRGLLED